ncbi:uncharacterized protein LOC110257690 [Sus scrofa]|uniref:uncharacterized protein LOC110257690 n=1 Tax=Sus scrofa TaxID=9823 RepID=UPI000A2B6E1D|nr:uncharacterized protein LOC110257690 [Sus scrofa]
MSSRQIYKVTRAFGRSSSRMREQGLRWSPLTGPQWQQATPPSGLQANPHNQSLPPVDHARGTTSHLAPAAFNPHKRFLATSSLHKKHLISLSQIKWLLTTGSLHQRYPLRARPLRARGHAHAPCRDSSVGPPLFLPPSPTMAPGFSCGPRPSPGFPSPTPQPGAHRSPTQGTALLSLSGTASPSPLLGTDPWSQSQCPASARAPQAVVSDAVLQSISAAGTLCFALLSPAAGLFLATLRYWGYKN